MAAPATEADALRVYVSAVEVTSLHAVGTVPGVAILQAAGHCGPGRAAIQASGDGTFLAFRAPGSATFGEAVDVSAGGTFLLIDGEDPNDWIRVEVYETFLADGPAEAAVWLQEVYTNDVAQPDITAGEASAGDVLDYELTLTNDSAKTAAAIAFWVDDATPGLEVSADGITYGPGTMLADLAASASATVYLRRTIAASASADPEVLNLIHFRYDW